LNTIEIEHNSTLPEGRRAEQQTDHSEWDMRYEWGAKHPKWEQGKMPTSKSEGVLDLLAYNL
jgi:hypothetical protein